MKNLMTVTLNVHDDTRTVTFVVLTSNGIHQGLIK